MVRKKKQQTMKEMILPAIRWTDESLVILCLFQQFFSHIRMMGGCNGTLYKSEKISTLADLQPRTARSVGQHLTYWATGASPWFSGIFVQIFLPQNCCWIWKESVYIVSLIWVYTA